MNPSYPSDGPSAATLQGLYAEHGDFVRRNLAHFGVRRADLDDMCHEVFLVVHAQSDQLAQVRQVPLWLRTICWRAAAGYRRRAHRRVEVLLGETPEVAAEGSESGHQELERREEHVMLMRALDRLNDETRDLLALHDLGDTPMTLIAELLDCDRKTAHRRLAVARRRLANLLRDETGGGDLRGALAPSWEMLPPEGDTSLLNGFFQVLDLTPDLNIGLIGNVLMTYWNAAVPPEAMDLLESHSKDLYEICDRRVVYFATVGPKVGVPRLEARKRILEILRTHGHIVQAYGTAIQGGHAWVVQPIMTGLVRLIRPPFPMRFFSGIEKTAAWLAPFSRGPEGPLTAEAVAAAASHLARLTPPPVVRPPPERGADVVTSSGRASRWRWSRSRSPRP
jgi:RNA polymerase sigma-70 factor (ECF subfamily)